MTEILTDALRDAFLITGLVVIMMMLVDSLGLGSAEGLPLKWLRKSKWLQTVFSTLLGISPGCVGGIASVSLYRKRVFSFGALVAMMIATTGDEAFAMLGAMAAARPAETGILFAILAVIALASGFVIDLISRKTPGTDDEDLACHGEHHSSTGDIAESGGKHTRHWHFTWQRGMLLVLVAAFLIGLVTGVFEESHDSGTEAGGLGILNEEWTYWVFTAAGIAVMAAIASAADHFVAEHLWHHTAVKHAPRIFAWTLCIVFAIGLLYHFTDPDAWISGNTTAKALILLLAVVIGFIPESGPHFIFVMLFTSGTIPFSVLLANSISQDGHASLPLLAEDRKSFIKAKTIKTALALVLGYGLMFLGY